MSSTLRRIHTRYFVICSAFLVFFAFDARAQITIGIDDIDAWINRPIEVLVSTVDSLESTTVVDAIISAEGENATYDFRGIPFEETMDARLTYHLMSPESVGAGVDYFAPATHVTELDMDIVENEATFTMRMFSFSQIRADSVYQRGAIIQYGDGAGTIEAADTVEFDPPTLSEPASFTYGDSWVVQDGFQNNDTNVEVVGYGTLITPSGEERQALRVERSTAIFGLEMKTIEFVAGSSDGIPGVSASIAISLLGDIGEVSFTEATGELGTNIAGTDGLPESTIIHKNYPNPFSSKTTIPFELTEGGTVDLRVYDMLGREVAVLVDGVVAAGEHERTFDASGLPSGTYLYRLDVGGSARSGMMTLLR